MLSFTNQSTPTWDEPIDMLFACHGKVKKVLPTINAAARLFGAKRRKRSSLHRYQTNLHLF